MTNIEKAVLRIEFQSRDKSELIEDMLVDEELLKEQSDMISMLRKLVSILEMGKWN